MQDVAAISRAIQETNPCTQPVFFLTWGKRDGDTQNCNNGNKFCTFDGVQDLLTQAYLSMAYVAQPASVAPAGEAWRSYSDRNSLFSGDGPHHAGDHLAGGQQRGQLLPARGGGRGPAEPRPPDCHLQGLVLARGWRSPLLHHDLSQLTTAPLAATNSGSLHNTQQLTTYITLIYLK